MAEKKPNILSFFLSLQSNSYDGNVNPEAYDAYVQGRFRRREVVAAQIAALFQEYMSPRYQDGYATKILDIAAGTGIISRALTDVGYGVTATDLSEGQLAFLSDKTSRVKTVVADMNEKFPFPSESFHGATTVYANRFVDDSETFLRNVHDMLKPGGIFVWPVYMNEAPLWRKKQSWSQTTSLFGLRRQAKAAGFTSIEKRVTPFFRNAANSLIGRNVPFFTPSYLICKK